MSIVFEAVRQVLSDNPFQPPIAEPAVTENEMPPALIVLIILCGLHIVLALLMILLAMLGGGVPAGIQGLLYLAFIIGAFVGLLMKQEWARISLLWMIYCGCAFLIYSLVRLEWFVLPPLLFFVLTIFVAHLPSVKRATQRASTAQAYVYTEKKEENAPQ